MDNIQLTKICTKCGVEKPANTDFFYTQKSNGIKRLVAQCKYLTSLGNLQRQIL